MGIHRIQRQYVEVMTDHIPDAFRFKEQLSEVCKHKLLPALEKLFDIKAPDHKIFRTGKLVIDVGELPVENWETLFVDRVVDEMTKHISAAVPLSSAKSVHSDDVENELFQEIDEETNVTRSIIHFLEHGVLPWFTLIKSKGELQHWMIRLLDNENFMKSILQLIQVNANVVDRLIFQFEEIVSEKIVIKNGIEKKFIEVLRNLWKPSLHQMQLNETRQRRIIYKALLSCMVGKWEELTQPERITVSSKNILNQFPMDEAQRIIGLMQNKIFIEDRKSITDAPELITKKEKQKTEQVREPLYVTNAGLVILHPFLPSLFVNTGYTEKKEWLSEEVQYRAIALMQYLVTGKEEYPEFDLMLNKILTGFPLDKTLPADIALSDFEKSEGMDLLNSIIKHWTALKNTSVEGLQSTFLMREGKLSMSETGWLLQVEQKTVDILMGKLPWGISIVKTPWMEKMIQVEWA